MSTQTTHVLVALSADILSGGLAADFVKISKEFITAGIAPTCLSNIDLRVLIHRYQGPILYGREEMGAREEVVGLMEPPFYHLVKNGLKSRVIQWIQDTSTIMSPNESAVIVITGHGMENGGILFYSPQQGKEWLEVKELYNVLHLMPQSVNILLVNLACYSDHWRKLASLGGHQQITVETASLPSEISRNHLSKSRRCRCSWFRHAWITEWKRYPTV